MTAAIKAAIPEKRKFMNEYTETAIINQVKAELEKTENTGKSAAEILEALTKDKPGIWENPNPVQDMPGTGDVELEGANEISMRKIFGL